MKPRIAVYDIETSPHIVYSWGLYKQNISPNMIIENSRLLSVGYKWIGEDKLHYYDCRGNPHDDTNVVQRIWELFDNADILVGQNIQQFDTRKANARMIELGMSPPSPYKQIDTKVEAKKVAMFTSNKLEWLAEHLSDQPKDSHSEFPGFELWSECLKGNPRAWDVMEKYNKQDVSSTEEVYLKLRPWMTNHPNINAYDDSAAIRCPKCGSHNVQRRGSYFTQSGQYTRYHCQSCFSWSRTRYTENSIEKRRSLLGN